MTIKNMNEFSMKMIVLILIGTFIFATFSNVTAKQSSFSSVNEYTIRTTFLEQTRAVSTDNYTQLCLDFTQDNYPNHTIDLVYSIEKETEETGIKYTVVKVEIQYLEPTPNSVVISVNHETGNIEFGDEQIKRDYREFVVNLPPPYPKTDWFTRKLILHHLSDLPTIDEAKDTNLVCNPFILVNISDYGLLTDELNNSGYTINWVDVEEFRVQVQVDNVALHNYLRITNESFVISSFLLSISKKEINYLLIFVITFPILILGIIIYKIKKDHKLTLPNEGDKHDYQEYK